MDIIIGDAEDRIIDDVYAWVVTNKKTQLQGIFGMKGPGGLIMQCVTSSPDIALKIGEKIQESNFPDRKFTLYKYKRAEIIREID